MGQERRPIFRSFLSVRRILILRASFGALNGQSPNLARSGLSGGLPLVFFSGLRRSWNALVPITGAAKASFSADFTCLSCRFAQVAENRPGILFDGRWGRKVFGSSASIHRINNRGVFIREKRSAYSGSGDKQSMIRETDVFVGIFMQICHH